MGLQKIRTNAEAPAAVLEDIAKPDASGLKLLRDPDGPQFNERGSMIDEVADWKSDALGLTLDAELSTAIQQVVSNEAVAPKFTTQDAQAALPVRVHGQHAGDLGYFACMIAVYLSFFLSK